MLNSGAIKKYLDATVADIKADAEGKGQDIPFLRVEVQEDSGQVISTDYFRYLVLGRGPGKAPPPEKMLAMVKKKPDMLADAKRKFKYITEEGLAYIIGQSIAKRGTRIFRGEKPGVDMLGAMEKNMGELLKDIARNESVKILTNLRSGLNSKQQAFGV